MEQSLISVIIPVYNVEDYLKECLDSVVNQTYRNIEIIVINDGSTDKSHEIINKYSCIYKNIKAISQENQGQSIARNRGIEIARGKYIYFLDSDDYISTNMFETLIAIMEKNDLDLIRFYAEPFVDKIDRQLINKQSTYDEIIDSEKIYGKKDFLNITSLNFSASPVLYITKRDLFIDNNILFKPRVIHEDELFTTEVFLNTNKAMVVSNKFYKRRFRPNSTMTTNNLSWRKKSFDSVCIIINDLSKLLKKYQKNEEINFIKKRIRILTTGLMFDYDDIDKAYKRNRLKDLEHLNTIKYSYYFFRYKTSFFLSPIKKVIVKNLFKYVKSKIN